MMGDVALGALAPVELAEQVPELAAFLQELVGAGAVLPFVAAADDVDEVQKVAALDDQPAVAIGFGGAESGIAGDIANHPRIGEAHRHGSEFRIGRAVDMALPLMVDDCELAPLDIAPQHLVEQPHSFPSPGWRGGGVDGERARIKPRLCKPSDRTLTAR